MVSARAILDPLHRDIVYIIYLFWIKLATTYTHTDINIYIYIYIGVV